MYLCDYHEEDQRRLRIIFGKKSAKVNLNFPLVNNRIVFCKKSKCIIFTIYKTIHPFGFNLEDMKNPQQIIDLLKIDINNYNIVICINTNSIIITKEVENCKILDGVSYKLLGKTIFCFTDSNYIKGSVISTAVEISTLENNLNLFDLFLTDMLSTRLIKLEEDCNELQREYNDLQRDIIKKKANLETCQTKLTLLGTEKEKIFTDMKSQIIENPLAESAKIDSNQFLVTTKDLFTLPFKYNGHSYKEKYVGKYEIEYKISSFYIKNISAPNEKFHNLYTNYYNNYIEDFPCLGNFQQLIIDAVYNADFVEAFNYIVEFLISVNMNESIVEGNWINLRSKKPKNCYVQKTIELLRVINLHVN
jgi:hypothetical protein